MSGDGGRHTVGLSRENTQRRMNLKNEKNSAKYKEGENRFQLEGIVSAKAWRCAVVELKEEKYV